MMKRILLTSLTALILSASASGQAPPNGRKLATLGPDEYIVADESVLLGRGPAGCVADDFFVVTDARRSGKTVFFTYDKAGRKGPFDKITEPMLKQGLAAVEPRRFYLDNERSMDGIETIPDPGKPDNQSLSYRGKTVGPFQQIFLAGAAPDKSRAFAAGIRDKRLRFAATDGRDVPAVGMPDKLATSADGTKAVLVCRGNLTFVQGMEIKPESIDATQFDNVTLYALDGRKFGPFKKDDDFGEVWFLAESPDWVFTVGKVAYFNGAPLKPFAEEISKSRFWIDDAARYAWVEEEKLKFSDGASFPNPVMLNWVKRAGKTTLCWISILPNRDVVGYSRGL